MRRVKRGGKEGTRKVVKKKGNKSNDVEERRAYKTTARMTDTERERQVKGSNQAKIHDDKEERRKKVRGRRKGVNEVWQGGN